MLQNCNFAQFKVGIKKKQETFMFETDQLKTLVQ